MASDDHNRHGHELPWRIIGTGCVLDFNCARCKKNKPTMGRRMWKKGLKLWQCGDCVKSDEQRLANV